MPQVFFSLFFYGCLRWLQVIRTWKWNWETGNLFHFNFLHFKTSSLWTGQWVVPAGLPFSLYLQEVLQLDEIQLDKKFGATAGDADMGRRFPCLLFGSFHFSLDYIYYHYFRFHLFCSSERMLDKHSRSAASLGHGHHSLVCVSGTVLIYIREHQALKARLETAVPACGSGFKLDGL